MSADFAIRDWVGRRQESEDRLLAERARAMQATLGREPDLSDGDALPPLWHWLYFWQFAPRGALGRDGHPALGGFLPPLGTVRRMWAGSRVRFRAPLRLGETARRTSTITAIEEKSGRSGRLVFVTVRHEISGAAGLAIEDEHDIVYRPAIGPGGAERPGEPASAEATAAETVTPDPVLLFRYSALTFNGHRIHYDRDYAREVEGYGGLVVHGPLLATLMLDLGCRHWPARRVTAFSFRGQRPVLDTAPFTLAACPAGEQHLDLWVAGADGFVAMRGAAEFA
jgi:3-methylfumaryl-CoA hydratase